MGPGPRFEPESRDPQSRRMTAYPTPAFKIYEIKNLLDAGAGIRTLVDLRQQVLSLSPLASRAPPLNNESESETIKNLNKFFKMLRPGFEPESSARKAEMIGRTTPPEQQIIKSLVTWAQWGSNP